MKPKLNTLFENEKFKAVFPLFFQSAGISITEAGKQSNISRTTLYYFRNQLKEYYEIKPSFEKEKLYSLDIKILVDYLAEKLKLDLEETQLLAKILSQNDIQNLIRKNNLSLEMIISKLIILFISFKILYRKQIPFFSAKEYYSSSKVLQTYSSEELDKFTIAVEELIKKNDPAMERLINKVCNSDFKTLTYPADWFSLMDMFGGAINPLVKIIKEAHLGHKIPLKILKE